MKTLPPIPLLLFFLIGINSFAQEKDLKWLDIELSNYEYPYPVEFIQLKVQDQELKMGYMDVKPNNYNGKT